MNVVREYSDSKTKVRIHDDYISEENSKKTKEIIISLIINHLENKISN